MLATMAPAPFRFRSDLLRDLIAATGMKPKPWAVAHGFEQPQISRWLNGKTVPSLELAARLAKALGVSIDALIAWDEDPESGDA